MRVSAKLGAIEFDGDVVRVAVVKTGGRRPVVIELQSERAVYEAPGDRLEALAGAVRALMDRLKNRPEALVLGVSCEWTIVRLLMLPVTGNKRVSAAVQFELEPYLAFPIEDLAVDHTVIRSASGQTHVLAVGMRRTSLEEHLSILEAAEVTVDGIDVDAVGLASLWLAGHAKEKGLRAALHVRAQNSVLTIMNNKTLAYFRLVPSGAAQIQENPKAVARAVLNSLRSFQAAWNRDLDAQDAVGALTVSGIELFEEERALFETEMGVPVQFEDLIQPLKGFEKAAAKAAGGEERAAPGTWAGVIGVANAAAGESFSLNFRRGDYEAPNPMRGLRSQIVFSAGLALILLLGFGGYAYVSYSKNMAEAKRLGDAIWTEYAETFPVAANETPRSPTDLGGAVTFQRMKTERDAWYERAATLSVDTFTQPTMLEVLMELSKAMPGSKIDLLEVRVTPGRGAGPQLYVKGEAAQSSSVDEMESALRQSPVIALRPDSVRRTASGGSNKESFQLYADIVRTEPTTEETP